MNMITKTNIYKEHLNNWLEANQKGDKKVKGDIISHICFITGCHSKSVPRSFKRLQLRGNGEEKRGRKEYYTPDVILALKDVWDTASESCGENLHGIIGDYVNILKRDGDWSHSPEVTAKLLEMSLGTMKKKVSKFKRTKFVSHGKSSTKAGSIHSLIPIRRGDWDKAVCGTMQIDTIAHCGHTLIGGFIYTVNSTDVATLWGSRRAQWNKGKIATVKNMEYMTDNLPFPVVEWHPDSGSEFINWHCKEWCDKQGYQLTRSRPNRKNDNCFIEERNGHIVRKWVGYVRFDVIEVVKALNDVYDVLNPYTNHFVASIRVISKERLGAKWKIAREKKAKTPYQRVLERDDVTKEVKNKLKKEHAKLNPLRLKKEIDRRLKKMFNLQKSCGEPMV
jgi:hypothetical protein